jgi:hypothetical protein
LKSNVTYIDPEFSIVACNWKNTELLKVFIEGLINSLSLKTEIYINLNEADQNSIEYLNEVGIKFVAHSDNKGTAAVDCLTPLLKSEWVSTINDDEIPYLGWQDSLKELVSRYWPCCPSVTCVEPEYTGNPMVIADNCGHILHKNTRSNFISQCDSGVYYRKNLFGYQHPTLYLTEAWKAIGGYSCGLPFDFFGLAGYCLDDYFNYKMKQFLGKDTKFIVAGDAFCYHQVSHTTKLLPSSIKNFDAHSKFVELTGISTQEFRQSINWSNSI